MKSLIFCSGLACTSLAISAKARDILPNWQFENLPATDGSTVQALVFTTTPGIAYQIESSEDLVTWQTATDATTYGLGQTFTSPLRRIAAVPAPDPSAPPPSEPGTPVRHVSLLMIPCSDPGGGTVLSWPSLENGAPLRLRIPETMAGEWLTIPFFFERYGAFAFCVLRTADSTPAPATGSILKTTRWIPQIPLAAKWISFAPNATITAPTSTSTCLLTAKSSPLLISMMESSRGSPFMA